MLRLRGLALILAGSEQGETPTAPQRLLPPRTPRHHPAQSPRGLITPSLRSGSAVCGRCYAAASSVFIGYRIAGCFPPALVLVSLRLLRLDPQPAAPAVAGLRLRAPLGLHPNPARSCRFHALVFMRRYAPRASLRFCVSRRHPRWWRLALAAGPPPPAARPPLPSLATLRSGRALGYASGSATLRESGVALRAQPAAVALSGAPVALRAPRSRLRPQGGVFLFASLSLASPRGSPLVDAWSTLSRRRAPRARGCPSLRLYEAQSYESGKKMSWPTSPPSSHRQLFDRGRFSMFVWSLGYKNSISRQFLIGCTQQYQPQGDSATNQKNRYEPFKFLHDHPS